MIQQCVWARLDWLGEWPRESFGEPYTIWGVKKIGSYDITNTEGSLNDLLTYRD